MSRSISWKSPIKQLSDKDFSSGKLKAKGLTAFGLIYADWCHHCHSIAPLFQELSKKFPSITFFVVEDSKGKKLQDTLKIQGFPTMVLYRNGYLVEEYRGRRDPSSLVEYLMNV